MDTICQPTNFLHVGNILFLIAYLVRDVLWLRVITVVATVSMIVSYFLLWTSSSGVAIAWCSLFTIVNVVQIAILILERRPVYLGEEELHLYRTTFKSLKPREFLRLLSIAEWRKAARRRRTPRPAKTSAGADAPDDWSGRRGIRRPARGRRVSRSVCRRDGLSHRTGCQWRVVASATTDYLAWPTAKLRSLLAAAPTLHVKFQAVLGCDLVSKLHHEAVSAAHPSRVATALRSVGVE